LTFYFFIFKLEKYKAQKELSHQAEKEKKESIMAQRRLTIELPRSPEALHNVLQMLLQYGLISKKKAHNIEHEKTSKKTGKKSR
jgi:hypothetical protein